MLCAVNFQLCECGYCGDPKLVDPCSVYPQFPACSVGHSVLGFYLYYCIWQNFPFPLKREKNISTNVQTTLSINGHFGFGEQFPVILNGQNSIVLQACRKNCVREKEGSSLAPRPQPLKSFLFGASPSALFQFSSSVRTKRPIAP